MLQTKVGWYQTLYLYNGSCLDKCRVCEWSEIKEGDIIFVVGEGLYEGYGGKWQETLFESEWEGEEDMVHTRPYKYTDEDVDVFELLLSIKFELPVLYAELLECFGFGYGRRAKIKEKVKIALTKYSQLFVHLQGIYACL